MWKSWLWKPPKRRRKESYLSRIHANQGSRNMQQPARHVRKALPASVRFPRKQQRYPKWLLETNVSGCDGPKTFLKLTTSRDFRTQQQSHLRSEINRETFRILVASSTNSLDPPPTHFWWTRHSRPLSVCLEPSWILTPLGSYEDLKNIFTKKHTK